MPLHGRHRHFQRHLNGTIAVLFACGAALFMLGGALSLAPMLAARWSLDSAAINLIYFAGSIPFTTAAYLQLFQSANVVPAHSGDTRPPGIAWIGWRPGDVGWLGCAMQFAGTLLFNLNTFDAQVPGLDWLQQDLAIWAPDMIGSALFLASGYLSFIECFRTRGAWQPASLAWWITVINLLGCVAFMASALLAFTPATGSPAAALMLSTQLTVTGAAAFLAGSLLMLPQPVPGNE